MTGQLTNRNHAVRIAREARKNGQFDFHHSWSNASFRLVDNCYIVTQFDSDGFGEVVYCIPVRKNWGPA